jgi:hypothetical protein
VPGFANVKALVDAYEGGRSHFCSFRKVPSQTSVPGWWVDLSMAAGNPSPNYYASSPLVAAKLDSFKGIFHGEDQPGTKFLSALGLVTPTAGLVGQYMMLDYLLYYPFVDGDDSDAQVMDNTEVLDRYTDGKGVMVMAVIVAPTTGSGQFTFTYINQDGVERTSPIQYCATTAANIASLATSQQAVTNASGPFLTLASGDSGVRSIVSVQFSVLNGGLVSLVLVKPLGDYAIREINTMSEVQYMKDRAGLPQIQDGAYLNLIQNCAATVAAGQLAGYATFAWSEA